MQWVIEPGNLMEDGMYRHHRQNLIGRAGGQGGLARRRFLQGTGALGLAATLRPTVVLAERDDDDERLGPFGPWSTPVNLDAFNDRPVINNVGLGTAVPSFFGGRASLVLQH